jgi:hypothetical protein
MDETKKNVYTRLTDDTGTIGIMAVRDKNNELTGFEEVDYWIYNSDADVVEQRKDSASSKGKGISNAVETGSSDADTLNDYIGFGVTYSNKFQCWIYNDKKVEALIDGSYFYLNEGVTSKKSIALQVLRNSKGGIKEIKVISKNKLDALIDAIH